MAAGSPSAGGELVEEREEISPSGRYRLVVTSLVVIPGGWMHSCGSVFSQKEGRLIATIRRNFHHFPFLFVEGHPKGDFLVAGEDYQGQTVVELTTGQRRDALSPGAEDGNGFCWVMFQ